MIFFFFEYASRTNCLLTVQICRWNAGIVCKLLSFQYFSTTIWNRAKWDVKWVRIMFSLAPRHLWSPAPRFSKMEEWTARRWFFLTWESTFSTTVCFEISTPGKLKDKTPLKYLPLLTCPPSKLSLKLQVSPSLANREAWTTASQSRENGLRHRCLQIIKACFWPASFANTAPGQGWKQVELSDHVGISVDQLRLRERIKAPTACYLLLGWAANMHRTTQRDKPLGKAEKQLQPAHR